jgi:hypothetical protein
VAALQYFNAKLTALSYCVVVVVVVVVGADEEAQLFADRPVGQRNALQQIFRSKLSDRMPVAKNGRRLVQFVQQVIVHSAFSLLLKNELLLPILAGFDLATRQLHSPQA